MKNFSQFIKEIQSPAEKARSLNLVSDKHGGWYDRKGEFTAKTKEGKLVFYNKRQIPGRQDPYQSQKEKTIASPGYNDPRLKAQAAIRNREKAYEEKELREKYIKEEIFNVDDWVKSLVTEKVGKIIRRGTNHLICVTEDGEMFKSWIKDLVEYTEVKMDRLYRLPGKPNTLIGTTGYRKNAEQSLNFINKYRKKVETKSLS